jgi:hypothetical protein
MPWFDDHLAGPLGEIRAERFFCVIASSLQGVPDHFSHDYCGWFAARGGVLCHLAPDELEPYEHWIGVGVDPDVVRPEAGGRRDEVVFDFPRSSSDDPAASFDVGVLAAVRARLPQIRIVGTGPADAPIRAAFDVWVEYGQEHTAYATTFSRAIAVVPGWYESMGLAMAEAQMAGGCVVWTSNQMREAMLVPEASIRYDEGDPGSLVEALATAATRDASSIRAAAMERFDLAAVADRTRRAIGL